MSRSKRFRPLLITWLVLLALTAISYALTFASLGRWALPAGMLIGAIKTALVGLVFVHLAHQRGAPRLIAVASIVLVLALLVGVLLG